MDRPRPAEQLGYTRHWFAERHNIPSVASSSPEVLIAHVAAATRRIRVGSGGILLPNHAPLRVAETFHTLEALHPGRIDLGIGRAPGARIEALVEETGADEVMITTTIPGHEERLRSYDLVAEAFSLVPAATGISSDTGAGR